MNIQRIPIRSGAALGDDRPWYAFTVSPAGELAFTSANRRGEVSPLQGRAFDLPAMIAAAIGDSDRAMVAVDVQDELVAIAIPKLVIPEDGTPPVIPAPIELHAHLGWYDRATDTLDLLEFVDDTPVAVPAAVAQVLSAIDLVQQGAADNVQLSLTDDELAVLRGVLAQAEGAQA